MCLSELHYKPHLMSFGASFNTDSCVQLLPEMPEHLGAKETNNA